MLKRRLCEAVIEWKLTCEGPLLIADGRYDQDRLPGEKGKYPNKVFISRATPETIHNNIRDRTAEALNLSFYVPGTSLRGPFRSQAERIIRSLLPEHAAPSHTACNPFDMDDENILSCSKRFDKKAPQVPYAEACPACKLFGCTGTASRIQFTDADIKDPAPGSKVRSVYRDMIGIDRFTGGVYPGANMRFHALENTAFTTTVTVTNFELWQLGLLAYVLRDFEMGLVSIGFGKAKGFGLVKGEIRQIVLSYLAGKANGRIQHLGSLATSEERQLYGLHVAEPPTCALSKMTPDSLSLYETFKVENRDAFWADVASAFNAFIKVQQREVGA